MGLEDSENLRIDPKMASNQNTTRLSSADSFSVVQCLSRLQSAHSVTLPPAPAFPEPELFMASRHKF